MGKFKIYRFNTGISPTSRANVIFHPSIHKYVNAEGIFKAPTYCFLAQNKELNILIDTGLPSNNRCKMHFPDAEQLPEQSILMHLKRMKLKPTDIDIVIFTHLHWDHCGYSDSFTNATFYVQRKEYEMAMAPLPMYSLIYEGPKSGLVSTFYNHRFELVEGPYTICEGISVYPSFGHSIGHQSVTVETDDGVYHCCGDLCFTKQNLKSIPGTDYIVTPPARFESLNNIWNSLVYLKEAADLDHILLCHE